MKLTGFNKGLHKTRFDLWLAKFVIKQDIINFKDRERESLSKICSKKTLIIDKLYEFHFILYYLTLYLFGGNQIS